jgi:glycosyltransferase involved in cell wall biosynthesis
LLVAAGTGPLEAHLAARISTEGLPVRLLGHRPDVSNLLAAADVAVLASEWEARPLFAQEALRAGVPLVGTRVGGVPGLVGSAAVLVPYGDVDALSHAVSEVLNDRALAEDLVNAGHVRVATWPDEDATVDQVASVYEELLSRRAT